MDFLLDLLSWSVRAQLMHLWDSGARSDCTALAHECAEIGIDAVAEKYGVELLDVPDELSYEGYLKIVRRIMHPE